jgi:hypothetical protein
VTEREPSVDESEVATSEFGGFEEAIDRLLAAKPGIDAASDEMRQRIQDCAGDEPPIGSGRPRSRGSYVNRMRRRRPGNR